MTLPASPNSVSIGQINTETGVAETTNKGLSWLSSNMKGGATNLDVTRNKAWYQKNNAYFNCTLDNRDSQCNCNNCNCGQCGIADCGGQCLGPYSYGACSNCACDNRSWLQNNCNCGYTNCAYNCYLQRYNCDCACRC